MGRRLVIDLRWSTPASRCNPTLAPPAAKRHMHGFPHLSTTPRGSPEQSRAQCNEFTAHALAVLSSDAIRHPAVRKVSDGIWCYPELCGRYVVHGNEVHSVTSLPITTLRVCLTLPSHSQVELVRSRGLTY